MKGKLLALALLWPFAGAAAEPLIFDHGRLFVAARINGVPTEALLDSAAEATLIDPGLAESAKLAAGEQVTIRGSGGAAQARLVPGVRIEALGLALMPEAVVVTDLSELSKRLLKRPTQAVVGRELFDAARLRIDIGNGIAEVVSPDQVPVGRRLPLSAHAGVESIPVKVNGTQAQAEFDLGNGSDVLISRGLAKKLRLKVRGRRAGGGIGGSLMRDVVRLNRLEIAGMRLRNVTAAIDDQPSANDLNVGTSILRHFLITTDFKRRVVWLEAVGRTR